MIMYVLKVTDLPEIGSFLAAVRWESAEVEDFERLQKMWEETHVKDPVLYEMVFWDRRTRWYEGETEESLRLFQLMGSNNYIQVKYPGPPFLTEAEAVEAMKLDEAQTEIEFMHVNENGISFSTGLKHTDVLLTTEPLPWSVLLHRE